MKKKLLSSTGLIAAFAFLLVINLISGLVFKSAKLDLTENQLYTLSRGTENILSNLSEPLTLRLYFSEKFFTGIPNVLNYGGRVKDLLDEYVSLSHGQLSLIIADPEPFSETEDEAVKYGLQGVPVDSSGNQAYFGLVGVNGDEKHEAIAFFQPDKEASLEYDVTRLIYSLANPKRTMVGLMSSLPMEGMPANPFMQPGSTEKSWFILNQIKQSFDVKTVSQNVAVIPDDIDVLMLVHPKALSDETLLAIDQFVLAGGRLLAFVDPFSEADQPASDPSNPMAAFQAKRSSELTPLFDAWGVELVKDKIATDKKNAQRVQVRSSGRIKAVDYIAWMSIGKDFMNASDFITRDLEKLTFATPGYFIKKPDSTLSITRLISTSDDAMAIESTSFQFGANPEQLLRKYASGGKPLSLALRVSGQSKTAFPNGVVKKAAEVKPEEESEKKPETETILPKLLTGSVNVILVADSDFLEDKQWVRIQNFFGNQIATPHASNNVFVLNAIENLGGSNDLISLRSRSKSSREFTKVFEIKTAAEKRFRDQERALQTKLEETERKLAQLQQKKGDASGAILTQEQQQEIEEFRNEQLQTRKALRNVQHELVKSIESLGSTLKAINIGLMSFLVILFAIGFNFLRRKRLNGQN